MTSESDVNVVLIEPDESLVNIFDRIELPTKKKIVVIFPRSWKQSTARSRKEFFARISSHREQVVLVTLDRVLQTQAREENVTVVHSRSELKEIVHDHPEYHQALRQFSFAPWQEWVEIAFIKLRKLSVHRIRIWAMLIGSIGLFFSVLFVALPSATIQVWPRVTLVNHTANVLLVASGADVPLDRGQNILPLIPISVEVSRSLTFDQISKNFTGENARVLMRVINESDEPYSIRAGTRLVNQAGMVFKTLSSVTVPEAAGIEMGTKDVEAEAVPEDIYGEIVGDRGNVPAGLRWDFPGLTSLERVNVYARNLDDATGGITEYGTLLQQKDLDLARVQIEEELFRAAKARVEEEIEVLRTQLGRHYVLFAGSQYEILTVKTYSGITIPMEIVGKEVKSIPIEGALSYSMLAYDKDALMEVLQRGLQDHVEDGYELVSESVIRDRVAVYVIEFDDDLTWVKVTGDLTGKQQAVLSPTSAFGRLFGEKLRDMVTDKTVDEAKRIIQNFSEVDKVEVSVWPPWQKNMPALSNHIVIIPVE